MPVSTDQAVRHFHARREQAQQAIAWYQALRDKLVQALEHVRQEAAASRQELAAAYLLDMSADSLSRAERLTGFRGFTRRRPLEAMAREKVTLEKLVARIRAGEQYQKREELAGPHGKLTQERDEAQSMLAPWETECQKFESIEGFLDLVTVRYDTPEFGDHWWEPQYWKHWATGDRVCKELGMDDFGDDVLPAYTKVFNERERWRQLLADAEAKVTEVHNLVRQHDNGMARIPRLPELYLEQCQRLLAEYIDACDLPLLDEWLHTEPGEDRGIRMALRKLSGLRAKAAALDELVREGISPLLVDLRRREEKYDRKLHKFMRPKYARRGISDRELDLKFDQKWHKLRRQHDKLVELVDRMMRYDDYACFDLSNDPDLWWVEFTGKPPSRLTPRLRKWYERNPGVSPVHDDEMREQRAAQAVAAAAAARELDDVGYLS